MAKLTLDDVGNLNTAGLATINENSSRIEAVLENTLSRDGTSPNQMEADLDLNHNDIINIDNIDAETALVDTLYVNGSQIIPGDNNNINITGIFNAVSIDEDDMVSDRDDKLPTQQSVKAYVDTGTVYKVADRTALKAVDTGAHSVVYFDGSDWQQVAYSDVSDLVAADTAEGVYVRSTQDNTKVWVRQFDGAISVGFFGNPNGTDDTALFAIAAVLAPSIEYQTQQSGVLKAPIKYIRVPAGTWNITGVVPSSAMIIWILDNATEIEGAQYLTGTLYREGRHINVKHSGILENAQTFGLRAGKTDLDASGGIYGITTLDAISVNGPPHSGTLQIDNDTQVVPIELTGTTYTATSVTYTNEVDLGDVKVGASITSMGSPTMTGIITAVDEGAKTVTVDGGWRPFTGVSGATGTPTDGTSARIDYFAKIWAQNTNVFLRSGHPTTTAAGYEMGVLNGQSDAPVLNPATVQSPSMWGFDAVNLGTYKSGTGFIARGGSTAPFRTGFAAYGTEIGFSTYAHATHTQQVGFSHQSGQGTAFRSLYNGAPSFSVNANGSMEIGRTDAAAVVSLDFHSSGNTGADFDARILSSNGSATAGSGALTYTAAFHQFVGPLKIGSSGPIVTSGAGSPEGVLAAPVGSLYTRTDGGASTTLYVKESGTGNTGWVAK